MPCVARVLASQLEEELERTAATEMAGLASRCMSTLTCSIGSPSLAAPVRRFPACAPPAGCPKFVGCLSHNYILLYYTSHGYVYERVP